MAFNKLYNFYAKGQIEASSADDALLKLAEHLEDVAAGDADLGDVFENGKMALEETEDS